MHHPKRFLEKIMRQGCPATVGFWRFDSEGASGTVRFCDCRLRNATIGERYPTEVIDLKKGMKMKGSLRLKTVRDGIQRSVFQLLFWSFLLSGCGFQKGFYEEVSGIQFPRFYQVLESYDNGEFLTITSLQVDRVELRVFIQQYGLKKIERDFELYDLWGASFLQRQKPTFDHPIYGLVGDNGSSNRWIYLVDLQQETLWAEIRYPDWGGHNPAGSMEPPNPK